MKDFIGNLRKMDVWNAGVPFKRTNSFPLDPTSVLKLSELDSYLRGELTSFEGTAYPGQIIAVYDESNGKISFFGISLNSEGAFETQPLGGGNAGSSINSVQKVVISNGEEDEGLLTFAFKNAFSDDNTGLNKSEKLTELESDTSYLLDPDWKDANITEETPDPVISLRIGISNEEYHNIKFPRDAALAPKSGSSGTFVFRDSDLTLLLTAEDGDGLGRWGDITAYRSNVLFTPDSNNLVSGFWGECTHTYWMSKVVYRYGTTNQMISNGTLELHESEVHLYCDSTDTGVFPRPTISLNSGQSGRIYLHNSTAISIPEGLEAAIEIIICPENNRPDAIFGYVGQKGIKISGKNSKYALTISSNHWVEDDTNGGYKYSITQAMHNIFVNQYHIPLIKTYSGTGNGILEEVYDSPEIDLSNGNITVRVDNNNALYLVVISE